MGHFKWIISDWRRRKEKFLRRLLLGIKANWQCTTLDFPYNNDERRQINKEKWLHQATALSTGYTKEKSRPRWREIDFVLKKRDLESIFCGGKPFRCANIRGNGNSRKCHLFFPLQGISSCPIFHKGCKKIRKCKISFFFFRESVVSCFCVRVSDFRFLASYKSWDNTQPEKKSLVFSPLFSLHLRGQICCSRKNTDQRGLTFA